MTEFISILERIRPGYKKGGSVQLLTPGVIKTKKLYNLLTKAGLNLPESAGSAARVARVYGLKRPKEVTVQYSGQSPTVLKNPKQFYIKPTAAELKRIKKKYDINQLKKTSSGPGKEAFEKRKKRATQLLKTGKYTREQVNNIILKEFPTQKSGMKTTIKNLAKNIKGVPLGTGESGKMVQKVIKDLKDLDKSKVKQMLFKGESNIPKLIKETQKAIDVDKSIAVRRIMQLIEEYAGRNRYLPESIKDEKIIKATSKLRKGLGRLDSSRMYGGQAAGLQRKAAEEAVAKEMGMKKGTQGKSAVAKIKRKITDLMPRGEGLSKYQTDMVKNIRSGYKFNSLPYSVFAQGLREDINQTKGRLPKGTKGISLDRQTSLYENRIQKAENQLKKKLKRQPTDTEIFKEKKRLAGDYNKIAKDFAKNANKNLKKGQLPVRVLEFSFDPPKETIKNKAAYEKYGDKFDEVYKRHGYSFKVPADLKTLDQSLEFVKRPVGQIKIATAAKMGSPRAFATVGVPTPEMITTVIPEMRSPLAVDYSNMQLGTGRLAKAAGVAKNIAKIGGKALGIAAIPLEVANMLNMRKQGKTTAEILASPFLLSGRVAEAQDLMKMTPLERQAVSEQQIAGDESMLDTDFYTPTREGIEAVDIEAVKERVRKQREEEERQRALERSRRSGFTYPNMYGITSVEGVI